MNHVVDNFMNEQASTAQTAGRLANDAMGYETATAPMAQMLALPELGGPAEGDATAQQLHSAPLIAASHPLHQVKARLQVCVGEAVLTVGELMAAKENQVLRLNRLVDQPVDLLLEGRVVARGQLIAVDEHFGVRITELPIPLQLAPKA